MGIFGGPKDENETQEGEKTLLKPVTSAPKRDFEPPAPGMLTRALERSAPREPRTVNDEGNEGMATIGKSVVVKGDLTGDEDMHIEGSIEGGIQLPNHELTIGEGGKAQAELFAKSIIVIGQVTGNVKATERVEVRASGSIEGDIHAPKLAVEEGAVLNGKIEMSRPDAPAATSGGGGGDSARPASMPRGDD